MTEPIKWMKVAVIPPDVRLESALEPDPICRDELLPPEHLGCTFEWKGRCYSSLPCKYKGLCAGAPKTEQEV